MQLHCEDRLTAVYASTGIEIYSFADDEQGVVFTAGDSGTIINK
jgi:hypothetical protein